MFSNFSEYIFFKKSSHIKFWKKLPQTFRMIPGHIPYGIIYSQICRRFDSFISFRVTVLIKTCLTCLVLLD